MKRITQAIDQIEKALLVYPFLLLGCCIVFEVFTRKFLGFGLSWLQELGKYLMVYGTFLGATIAVRDRSHPSMSAIRESLPPKAGAIVAVAANLLCAACIAVVAYHSWNQLRNYIRIGTLTSSLGGLPMYVPFLPMPICLTTMSLRFLFQCFLEPRDLLAKGKGETAK